MKVLLDVCTPVQVRHALAAHEVLTAVKMGWGALENGALLQAAEEAGCELLIICDKNLRHQQNLSGRRLAILELWTNYSADSGGALSSHPADCRSHAGRRIPQLAAMTVVAACGLSKNLHIRTDCPWAGMQPEAPPPPRRMVCLSLPPRLFKSEVWPVAENSGAEVRTPKLRQFGIPSSSSHFRLRRLVGLVILAKCESRA